MKKIFLLVLFAATSWLGMAQNNIIKGTVTDEMGEFLIGASVSAGKVGTITDVQGKFSLAPEGASEMVVSYIGYKSKRIKLRKNVTFYEIKLNPDDNVIDNVVVIGYGAVKKGDVTASVSKVKSEDIEDRPVANVASALQGELAGVEIRTTSGKPGAGIDINVRGATTINEDETSAPLYVVDGVPMEEDFDLSDINIDDVASIEVLKDASSSAIYGSRGANGVVIVTMKKGAGHKSTITASANFSLQQPERFLDILEPEEWTQWYTKAITQAYLDNHALKNGATADDSYVMRQAVSGGFQYKYTPDYRWSLEGHPGVTYIDWQKAVFRIAPMQQYNIAAQGSNTNGNYRLSVGYTDQEGIIKFSDFKRLNVSLSGETTVKKRFTFGASVAPTISWQDGTDVDGKDNAAMGIFTTPPVAENEAGLYTGAQPYSGYAWMNKMSPLAGLERKTKRVERMTVRSSAYVRVNILKGLQAEIKGAWNYSNLAKRSYTPTSASSKWKQQSEGYYSTASWTGSKNNNFLLETLLTYNQQFGKHSVNLMAGWSNSFSKYSDSYSMTATQFPNDALQGFNMADETMTVASATYNTDTRLISYFGRAIYNFGDRYIVNVSLRRDGSSKFGSNCKWGTFPAISAAWRLSNERFWPKQDIVTGAKLRFSYGVNGRNNITANAARGLMTSANYADGETIYNGYAPSSSDNPDLTWQKVDSWDVALDMGFFHNRLSFSLDYYYKKTRDMLYQISLPAIMGYATAYNNIGSIENHGLELELKSTNIRTKNFMWTTALNIGFQGSKVLDLGENSRIFLGRGDSQVLEVGKPVGEYYMYDAIGVFQTSEDLEKYPHQATDKVGDVRYRDIDGNGVIDENDRDYFGNPRPDVTYGLNNRLTYKNWEFSMLLTAQTGGKIYCALSRVIARMGQGTGSNVLSTMKNMWFSEEDPGDGIAPNIRSSQAEHQNTTRWLYSSDFLKIKNVTLSYRVPLKRTSWVSSLRILLSVENAFMFDNYKGGYSPESNNASSKISYEDYGAYPMARVYSIGMKLTL